MGYSLGVDLGTTYTAAAVCRGATAEVVFLGDRAPQVPSVVFRPPEGPLLLGEAAERHALTEPERIAREFKRRIGDRTDIYVGGTPMTPISLSRALLNWTIERVIPGEGDVPDLLTVSCPANWHEFRRELMDQVLAVNADVEATLCTEPEAAAMHLAASGRVTIGESIAVYDLGGGTFDACVLRRTGPAEFELGASEGIEHCGGADFDGALLRRVLAEADLDELDPDDQDPEVVTGVERLRRECVEAKEALSVEVAVDIVVAVGSHRKTVRVTRQELEELIRPRIDETADCLARALRRAGLTPAGLGAVMLVGGSSRIPLVSEVLTERLGRPVAVSSQPKLCVAMGAALLGAARNEHSRSPAGPPPRTSQPTKPAEPTPPIQVSLAAPAATRPAEPIHPTMIGPSEPAGFVPQSPGPLAAPADPTVDVAAVNPGTAPAVPAITRGSPAGGRRGLPWYRIASLALAAAALVMLVLPTKVESIGERVPLDVEHLVTLPLKSLRAGTSVRPVILGRPWSLPATKVAADGTLNVDAWKIALGGTLQARTSKGDSITLVAEKWTPRRLVTIPGFLLILGALFSFAYAESLLRGIRRQQRPPSGGEVLGVAGAGAVAGVVVAAAPWIISTFPLSLGFVLAVAACVCAAVGLLAFGWERPGPGALTSGRG